VSLEKLKSTLHKLEVEMKAAAQNLEFEKAAELRDTIRQVRALSLDL
jgi:excinuclease ABC subunit B